MSERREGQPSFEEKKREFFIKLGLRAREWLQTHKKLGGLWEGPKYETKDGKRREQRWENVSKHCLVEAARGDVLADLLKLSPEVKAQLFGAAIIHDFDKKEEIISTGSKGRTPESFDEAYAVSRQKLLAAGIDPAVADISESVGHASIEEMETILKKATIEESDMARLAMHYLDDYALGSDWAVPFDGQKNDLDRRMDANDANPKYAKMAELGFYKEQRRVGYLVEQKLADLIRARSNQSIEAKRLPEYIDQAIKEVIEKK